MSLTKLLVAGAAVGFCSGALAQDYFDFGQIPGLPDQPSVEIDLNDSMLEFARQTAILTEPDAAELLSSIEGVQVRVYNRIEDVSEVTEYINDASSRLARDNWQQIVRVQEEGEVRIFVRMDESAITGVTAMIVDDGEAVFVNVAGTITPEQLAQAAAMAGADDVLESLGELNALNH